MPHKCFLQQSFLYVLTFCQQHIRNLLPGWRCSVTLFSVHVWTSEQGFFCLVSFDVRVCPLSPQSSFGRVSTAYIITYKCRSEEQKHQNKGSCHRYILLQHSYNTDTVAVDAVEELQPELIWRDVIFSWILHCSCQANSVSMQHDWSGGRPQSCTETSEVS